MCGERKNEMLSEQSPEDENLNFQGVCLFFVLILFFFLIISVLSSPDKCPLRKEKEKPKS